MKITTKDVENYLVDVLGYDEMMIDEFKKEYKPLINCLEPKEKKDFLNYCS